MEATVYHKVLNKEETYNGYKYRDSLNEHDIEFDENPDHSCDLGGLYFAAKEGIYEFLYMGDHKREVTLWANANW